LGRRRIENCFRAFAPPQAQPRGYGIDGRFQLEERVFGIAEAATRTFHIGGRKHPIGACGNYDGVLPRVVHSNQRDTGGFVPHGGHGTDIDSRRRQTCFQVIRKHVVSDTSHHANERVARQAAGGASLIGALSARNHLEAAAEHGFARRRQVPRPNYEIHVQTAEYDDRRFHRVRSIPSFFNSSA
jgi:hypothetical protein